MYLKSLTLRGFKSFARKTTLEFEPGITVIVGPNGSGKSNLADSIMWVLGEQSPSSLRSNRMDDVIFSGSAHVRPSNMAEVTLTLDNSNKDFPIDNYEVFISRNVVRGSESEYRLNDCSCRLLDIQELLSDAGFGKSLNSVVTQGNLDEILSLRPEERRMYIEEAGGLSKYRMRREKALRRLEKIESEYVRINEVIKEVKRQLRPLDRQAQRLEEYEGIIHELTRSEAMLAVFEFRACKDEQERYENEQRKISEELTRLIGELEELSSRGREVENIEDEWRSREHELRELSYRLVSAHERLKSLLMARERDSESRDRGEDRIEMVFRRLLEKERSLFSLEERLSEIVKRREFLKEKIDGLSCKEREITKEKAALEAKREMLSSQGFGDSVRFVSKVKGDERASLAEKEAILREEIGKREAHLGELSGKIDSLITDLAAIEEQRQRAFLDKVSLEVEQAALVSRLSIFSELDTLNWTVANATEELLKENPTDGELFGPLAFHLEIESGYEKAILGFLGPWAWAIAAPYPDAILQSIKYLKSNKLGISLFFKGHVGSGIEGQRGAVLDNCVMARDVIRAPEIFNDALDAIFCNVYIVDGVEQAFSKAEEYPGMVFITHDGDVVSSGTLIKGGSSTVAPAQMEATASRRESQERRLETVREEIDNLNLRLEGLNLHFSDVVRCLRELGQERQQEWSFLRHVTGDFNACMALNEYLSAGVRGGTILEGKDYDEICSKIDVLEEEGSSVNGRLEEARREYETLEINARSLLEEKAAINKEIEIARARKAELEEASVIPSTGEHFEEDHVSEEERLKRIHSRLVELAFAERERILNVLREGDEKAARASSELKNVRLKTGELTKSVEDLRKESHSKDLLLTELKVKSEQLTSKILDELHIPLEQALEQYKDMRPDEDLENKIRMLEERLEGIGPVNQEAIFEKQGLQEKFEFLKEQIEDIERAKSQLKRVIREIDRQIERRILDTLNEMNRHFQEIFSFFFPGGRAEIRLTEPSEVLSSGIDIFAEPQGKKLRRISLLSGGETALTAISFFFALFRVRPSPFYFLDEVEAALDDVNLSRFLELVKEFRKDSQLILITHQKRSMEIADVIYGVTMQEDGVSKVVSQMVEQEVA
ncbi:MAG: AAA family ATPase [Actinomycetota bacterium]|nr:AAA family ATPase [Actinomycetota bacterium]